MQSLHARLSPRCTLHQRDNRAAANPPRQEAEDRRRAEDFYPSIRNGDSLFQEFETLNFERPGYERYAKVIGEIRQLSSRLHENTKFEKLTKYGSANLYYLVADADVLTPHELPADWGWLRPVGDSLELALKPIWHDVDQDQRLEFLHRIAMTATNARNRRFPGFTPLK